MLHEDTIERLLIAHHVEEAHVRHVAALAESLFRHTRRSLQLSARDREILRAAALLHDIGYAADTANHVRAGVEILLALDTPELNSADRKLIAATVLLHGMDWEPALGHPVFDGLDTAPRALRLGAILRVADGLDHGHIQDVSIRSIRVRADAAQVETEGCAYDDNLDAAQRKAGLWRHAFGRDIQFLDASSNPRTGRYDGVIKPGSSTWEGLYRWLFFEYRIMGKMIPAMARSEDTEPLHDFRVSLRRFRSGLRMFRNALRDTSAPELNQGLAELADALGPMRDADARWDILRDPTLADRFGADPRWADLLMRIEAERDLLRGGARDSIENPETTRLMRRIARFLRVELPDRMREQDAEPFASLARKRLAKTFGAVLGEGPPDKNRPIEEMHALRKMCRRGRYWAEVLSPDLGRPARKLAIRSKALTDGLGDWRDAENLLERLEDPRFELPNGLHGEFKSRRRLSRKGARKAWDRIGASRVRELLAEK